VDVTVPELGENITEGVISVWHRSVGDTVKPGDVLCEVETDKVTVEIPAPGAGVVESIVIEAGDTAQVGERIAVLRERA
jgi:2-oxoglutarate dehydrogenase E2 component (dihydrolipoamide succinyltransferase)